MRAPSKQGTSVSLRKSRDPQRRIKLRFPKFRSVLVLVSVLCLLLLWANSHQLYKLAQSSKNYDKLDTAMLQKDQVVRHENKVHKSPNTVITAYFTLPSKFASERYMQWMSNMLSLQDAMVIFTSPNMVPHILKFRSHALNRTEIIPMQVEEVPMAKNYPTKFWEQELENDFEKRIHRSYQLFWVWLSKSWFVTEAIRKNPFDSDIFVWSDIGCFRQKGYNGKEMVLHPEVIPRHAIIQMAHHQPKAPNTVWFNDKRRHKENFYHSGSQMAGYKDTWERFHKLFMETIEGFIERKMFIGEDQAVLQSTCLQHPDMCEYIPHDQVKDNHYFGLRYALHFGGKYTIWRSPPLQDTIGAAKGDR